MTGESIQFAVDSAFSEPYGARSAESGVEKIMIVLTDGRAQVRIFTIAVIKFNQWALERKSLVETNINELIIKFKFKTSF